MSTPRRALITGILGQDGSLLADLLRSKGYDVHGMVRSALPAAALPAVPAAATSAGSDTAAAATLHVADITDKAAVARIIDAVQPHEVYHLAAQSHVGRSFADPWTTLEVNARGTLNVLEAVRRLSAPRADGHTVRLFHAASSAMYGRPDSVPQTETTPFHPRSPYACSKVYAFQQTVNYREAYGLFACNGILFNHESPRRGSEFAVAKITRGAVRIAAGLEQRLSLGNLDVARDWGYAPEFVEAMWLMLQHPVPDDFVIATNESHCLRELVELAFAAVGLDWRAHVDIDPQLLRPDEIPELRGDASRARAVLGWQARTRFAQLIPLLVEADRQRVCGGGAQP